MRNKYLFLIIAISASVAYFCMKINALDHPAPGVWCHEDLWVTKVEKSKNKILATSVHSADGVYTYEPDNLFDGDKDTCWCPKGKGINEFIILKIPKASKGFCLLNGVAKSEKIFKENNRVKRLYWALISEKIYESEYEEENDVCKISRPGVELKYCIAFQTAIKFDKVELHDSLKPQKIYFSDIEDFSWDLFKLKKTRDVYLIISIVDVYQGTKYNDTCISEIEIIK